ncbi:hypothetical protein B0H16DRAFT_1561899 [Mycena metata]|uniref:Uncharacterized protein n=1 Tax=Mycena metata TaxID=1033252 RepID=A0AAD7IHJ0_9AGAR|nr:hypothetical protein B0H16DRAFT_1561899 [Mycena metata]
MDPRPLPQLGDVAAWRFVGEPVDLNLHFFPTLETNTEHKTLYQAILNQKFVPDRPANAILCLLWTHSPKDSIQLRRLFLACAGIDIPDQQTEQIYSEVQEKLFGTSKMPATSISISLFYRILVHRLRTETALLLPISTLTDDFLLPPSPDFVIFVRLSARQNHEPLLHQYFDWLPWIQPDEGRDLRYAFSHGNWSTIGLFREVLNAMFGYHLVDNATNIPIYRDKACLNLVGDEETLQGAFYVTLQTDTLDQIPRFWDDSGPPKRDPKFGPAVMTRCNTRCAFSSSETLDPEDDLEAAHIFPRTGWRVFAYILKQFCPRTTVADIDHICNGLAIWLAIQRPWDRHRAAISFSRLLLILAKKSYPLSVLHLAKITSTTFVPKVYTKEFMTLIKLRFSQTMLEWFATTELQTLLARMGTALGPPKLEGLKKPFPAGAEDEMEGPELGPDPGHGKGADGGADNGLDEEADTGDREGGNGPSDDSEGEGDDDPGVDGAVEDWAEENETDEDGAEENEVEIDQKAPHYANCFCDTDADDQGPCVLLLFGATQLWSVFSREEATV